MNRKYYRRFKNHDAAPSVVSAKIIRNKHTGYSEGYGFVEFSDRATAERALRSTNGAPMPGTNGRGFRLNWASFGVGAASRNGRVPTFERHQQSVGTERTDRTNASDRRSLRDGSNPNADETRLPTSEEASEEASQASRRDVSCDATDRVEGVSAVSSDDAFDPNQPNQLVKQKKKPFTEEHSAFVGDLPPEVNDFALQETFVARYASVRNARVVTDPRTGRSKGFGFVRFADERERDAALVEMHGTPCGSRAMRLSLALPRKRRLGDDVSGSASPAGSRLSTPNGGSPERGGETDTDVVFQTEGGTSTREYARVASFDALSAAGVARGGAPATVFVGGLDPSVRESDLCRVFEKMGALTYVKIPRGRGCGFVQFEARASAETAIAALNGARVGAAGSKMRLSWVRANNPTYARGGARGFPAPGPANEGGALYYADAYHPGMPGMMPGMPGMGMGMGMESYVSGSYYFPAPGGGWMAPGGGWIPALPAELQGAYGRNVPERSGGFHPPAFASGPEASYAFAQQQYFAAQQRVPFERAAEFQTDPHTAAAAPASARAGPAPPPTPPGKKKVASGGGAAA